jgi:hypothetical protein
MLDQAMPAPFQLCPFFEVVKQLAIKDHDDVFIFIGHGLLAVREADDAQSARGQRDARLKKESLFIRAAMHQSPRHSPHDILRHSPLLREINNPCNPTHESRAKLAQPRSFVFAFCD